jgi:3-phosphoshikimate 1-carboxyvinyltransferase
MTLRQEGERLYCAGRLRPGDYSLPGNVSSQYISGLLMALPRLNGDSSLTIRGRLESAAYVTMTEDALRLAGIRIEKDGQRYEISGGQRGSISGEMQVEGDWSNAAFFLCAGALSDEGVLVKGLSLQSCHGDMAVLELLRRFGAQVRADAEGVLVRRGQLRGIHIDAAPIPDLIPVLSVLASFCEGETRVYHAGRLRLKESDRLSSTAALLRSLGGAVTELEDGLVIHGGGLTGGCVDSFRDHRIAMAAAAASAACPESVTIRGAEAVNKSYPAFFAHYRALGGLTREAEG